MKRIEVDPGKVFLWYRDGGDDDTIFQDIYALLNSGAAADGATGEEYELATVEYIVREIDHNVVREIDPNDVLVHWVDDDGEEQVVMTVMDVIEVGDPIDPDTDYEYTFDKVTIPDQ